MNTHGFVLFYYFVNSLICDANLFDCITGIRRFYRELDIVKFSLKRKEEMITGHDR